MTPRERALDIAARDFVAKVERGEARSIRSYAAFKTALAMPSDPPMAVDQADGSAR